MAPRETRVPSTLSFQPLSGEAAQRVRESMQAKNGAPAAKPGQSPAAKAAAQKAAAKAALADKKKQTELGWVAFTVDAGHSVEGHRFVVKTSDGNQFPGTLDAKGGARVEGLKPGKVNLSVVVGKPKPELGDITFEVVDDAGDAVGLGEYTLTNDAGTKVRGTLDAHGKATVTRLDGGAWHLKVIPAGVQSRKLSVTFVDEAGKAMAKVPFTLARGSAKTSHETAHHGGLDLTDLNPGAWHITAKGLAHESLTIELVDESGAPLASRALEFTDASGAKHEARTNWAGRATLHRLRAGTGSLRLSA